MVVLNRPDKGCSVEEIRRHSALETRYLLLIDKFFAFIKFNCFCPEGSGILFIRKL